MKKNQIINQLLVGHGSGNIFFKENMESDNMNKKWLEELKKNINKDKVTKLKLLFK